MACDLTAGRVKGCKDSIGGTSILYLFDYLADAFTITAGEATAMNVALTAAYAYELSGDGNPFTEEQVSDRNTGTVTNTQTITAILQKMDAATAAELNIVAKASPIAVIKDRNGIYHLVGQTDGIDFNISATTGSAKSDLNGFTLTGTAIEQNLSPKLDSTATAAFLAVVA